MIADRVPESRYGAPRRASKPRLPQDAVDVHLRIPAWLATPLYATARKRRMPLSGLVVLGMSEHLGVIEPSEEGDAIE